MLERMYCAFCRKAGAVASHLNRPYGWKVRESDGLVFCGNCCKTGKAAIHGIQGK